MIKKGYINDLIYPCVYIKKLEFGFATGAFFVDDINFIETPKDLQNIANYTEKSFNMNKVHPLSSQVIVRFLDPEKDHFHTKEMMNKYLDIRYHI